MSDTSQELLRMRVWIGIAIAFIASMIYSCNEVRYRAFGRTADADVLEVWQTVGKSSGSTQGYEVKYRFREESGAIRTESDKIGAGWSVRPPGSTVPVRYLQGSPEMSRLAERSNIVALIVFVGMCLVVVVKFIFFMREYKRDQAALARSRAASAVPWR